MGTTQKLVATTARRLARQTTARTWTATRAPTATAPTARWTATAPQGSSAATGSVHPPVLPPILRQPRQPRKNQHSLQQPPRHLVLQSAAQTTIVRKDSSVRTASARSLAPTT